VGSGPLRIHRGHPIADPDDTFDDVVDVGEVATHLSVVEDVDRFAFQDGLGEQEHRHVRSTPGAVDGEEAETGGWEAVEMAVGMGHQFVGLLRGGVEAQRVVHVVVDAEGHRRVGPVDGGGRGVGQVLHAVVSAALQNVHEADEVGVDVGVRILEGIADTGLGGEMDDALGFLGGEEVFDRGSIGEVEAVEAEVGVTGEAGEAGFLEADVVVVVEVVETDDLIAAGEEFFGRVVADEAGGAGDEDAHGGVKS